jgi:hypothetical protein
MEASKAALKEHYEQMKQTWGVQPAFEAAIPEKSLNQFCTEILSHA